MTARELIAEGFRCISLVAQFLGLAFSYIGGMFSLVFLIGGGSFNTPFLPIFLRFLLFGLVMLVLSHIGRIIWWGLEEYKWKVF